MIGSFIENEADNKETDSPESLVRNVLCMRSRHARTMLIKRIRPPADPSKLRSNITQFYHRSQNLYIDILYNFVEIYRSIFVLEHKSG